MPKRAPEFQAKVAGMKAASAKVKELEKKVTEAEEQMKAVALSVPNIPHDSVPEGRTEADNKVVLEWGDHAKLIPPSAKPHWDIAWFGQASYFDTGWQVPSPGAPLHVGGRALAPRARHRPGPPPSPPPDLRTVGGDVLDCGRVEPERVAGVVDAERDRRGLETLTR